MDSLFYLSPNNIRVEGTEQIKCASTINTFIPITDFFNTKYVIADNLVFYSTYRYSRESYDYIPSRSYRNMTLGKYNRRRIKVKIRTTEETPLPIVETFINYYIQPNVLLDEYGSILATMTFRSQYVNEVIELAYNINGWDYDSITEEEKRKYFCLIVDKKILDEEHKTMYKNFNKDYIEECIRQGIDVLYTANIKELCFNEAIPVMPTFNSIEEEEEHLLTITPFIYDEIETIARRSLSRDSGDLHPF